MGRVLVVAGNAAIMSVTASSLRTNAIESDLLALRCACADDAGKGWGRLVDATIRLKQLGRSRNPRSSRTDRAKRPMRQLAAARLGSS
jgi:hypothetical protein